MFSSIWTSFSHKISLFFSLLNNFSLQVFMNWNLNYFFFFFFPFKKENYFAETKSEISSPVSTQGKGHPEWLWAELCMCASLKHLSPFPISLPFLWRLTFIWVKYKYPCDNFVSNARASWKFQPINIYCVLGAEWDNYIFYYGTK